MIAKGNNMKPKLLRSTINSLSIILVMAGCYSTKNITTRTELWSPKETGPITILTKDSLLYQLDSYSLVESTLSGTGIVKKDGAGSPFRGNILLTNIEYIHAIEGDFLKSIIAVGGIAAVGSIAIGNLKGSDENTVNEQIGYYSPYSGGGGGSSCPYIYSWTGDRYVLDAEAFGIAFGKSLEISTSSVLTSLKNDNDILKIKIANERPETHYINKVQLMSVETDINTSVFLDQFNQAWPIYSLKPPEEARDNLGIDILDKISIVDDIYWESNNLPSLVNSTFKDNIELKFINKHQDVSIIITGINTEFSQVVFKNVFDFLGDQSLSFMQAVENDPEMINSLKNWIDESSLKVALWNGNEFTQVSNLHAEATAVPFSRVIRLSTKDIADDTIKIRLSCLTDVWKIDGIQIDWTPVQYLTKKPATLISALSKKYKDISDKISVSDNQYLVLLPPESIELIYNSEKSADNKKLVYILNAQGYLYEWFPPASGKATNALSLSIPSSYKVGYIKNLIRNKSLFLPPIYSQWIQIRKNDN
jgi:hypothetical protein